MHFNVPQSGIGFVSNKINIFHSDEKKKIVITKLLWFNAIVYIQLNYKIERNRYFSHMFYRSQSCIDVHLHCLIKTLIIR